ncbi:MAG: hypothetical protein OEX07_08435 [Gammaproteobacteria bacterium]|nr:hypothetical protein [Gammaproteobacteria bacterium]
MCQSLCASSAIVDDETLQGKMTKASRLKAVVCPTANRIVNIVVIRELQKTVKEVIKEFQ